MAFFELNSDVTIGKFRFSGVHEVQIKRSMHGIVDTATIKIPAKARITKNGKVSGDEIITGNQFENGQPVEIKLGYNGQLITEFKGFVKRRNLNMPMEVECEGYSWLLRKTSAGRFREKVTVKELLMEVTAEIKGDNKISVVCDVDMTLLNVVRANKTAFDMVQLISEVTDGALTCFFIEPDKLWCGLSYTRYGNDKDLPGSGSAKYKLGFNTLRENTLKKRIAEQDKMQVKYSKKVVKGKEISETSDVYKEFSHEYGKTLNQLDDTKTMKALANEKAYQLSYTGYEGNVNAFLQPYVLPGDNVYIENPRDMEQNGTYLVESTQVTFGIKGARRVVEIGPRLGFAKEEK